MAPVLTDPVLYRRQVTEAALHAAHTMLVSKGWDKVRFGQIAEAISVSRPTLYAVFGNKEGLAEALVLRETDAFLAGVGEALAAHETAPFEGVRAAVAFTLEEAGRNPVLHAILTSSRGGSESLLPMLTTRSGPVLRAASTVLVEWFREHVPGLPPTDVEEGVDALVRLVVSHLVLPADDPEHTADRLARLAMRFLQDWDGA